MKKTYVVRLTQTEREACKRLIKTQSGSSQKVRRAQMLLKADQGKEGPGWIDRDIADAFDARRQTVEDLRKRLVTEGFEMALYGKPRTKPPREPRLDGRQQAKLIAMRTGDPPEGYGSWSLRLLAKELVELEVPSPPLTLGADVRFSETQNRLVGTPPACATACSDAWRRSRACSTGKCRPIARSRFSRPAPEASDPGVSAPSPSVQQDHS